MSYQQLLDVFWANHNPTTRNRQGPGVGTQYRSAIFFHSPEQEAQAPQLGLHEQAHTLEHYARMMMQRDKLEPNPEYLERARAALSETADICAQMQSPLRLAYIRALLDAAPLAALVPTSITRRLISWLNFALDK